MKILAIDYGLKRIGLAYSEGSFAQPLGKLVVKNPIDALEKVLRTAHTYEVDLIIVGLPDPDSIGAYEFGEKLRGHGQFNIEFIDETMSSVGALEKLKTQPLQKRKELIDSAAATLILTSYLEGLSYRK